MSVEQDVSAAFPLKRRLNPFALPAETELRFNLLIVAALMMVLSLGHTISVWLSEGGGETSRLDAWDYSLNFDNYDLSEALNLFFNGLRQNLLSMVLPFVLLVLVLGIAFVIYRRHPARIRHRKQLGPLTADTDARLVDEVTWLAQIAGIAPPAIESGRGSKALDGQAFGFPRQYVIRLGGRLRLLLRKRPPQFRAIVLHEMGHIANRDVRRTYLAQSIWIAVLILALLTMGVLTVVLIAGVIDGLLTEGILGYTWGAFFTRRLPTYLLVLMQTAATLWLLTTLRGGVLRVRELYADWRAALWGAGGALSQILKASETLKEPNWLRRLTRLHPAPEERLSALEEPEQLFRMGLEVPLIAGLLVPYILEGTLAIVVEWGVPMWRVQEMISFAALEPLVNTGQRGTVGLAVIVLTISLPLLLVATMAIFLIPAYYVSQAVGVQMQRQAILHLLEHRRGCGVYLRLLVPAFLLAVGMQIGLIITPLGLLAPLWNDQSWLLLAAMPVWIPVVTVLMWVWLIYARYFGARVVGRRGGSRPPDWSRRVYTLGLTLVLWAMLAPVIIGQSMLSALTLGEGPAPIPTEAIPITIGIAFGVFLLLSIGTWAILGLMRVMRPARCGSCGAAVPAGLFAGDNCQTCQHPIAAWLYVDYAARDMALRVRRINTV